MAGFTILQIRKTILHFILVFGSSWHWLPKAQPVPRKRHEEGDKRRTQRLHASAARAAGAVLYKVARVADGQPAHTGISSIDFRHFLLTLIIKVAGAGLLPASEPKEIVSWRRHRRPRQRTGCGRRWCHNGAPPSTAWCACGRRWLAPPGAGRSSRWVRRSWRTASA